MPALSTPIANGRTAEIYAWEAGTVLKLYRSGFPPGDADREAAIGRIVHAAGIPTPAVFDVIDVNQRRGIIFERVEGSSMLDSIAKRPWSYIQAARQMADLQLGMHAQQAPQLPRFCADIEYAIQHAPPLPPDLRDLALQALARLPDAVNLCHGDFHPGNVIVTARGPLLIDWMNARAGNPWADVARTKLLLTVGEVPEDTPAPLRLLLQTVRRSFFQTYLRRYLRRRPDPDNQIQAWLPILAAARLSENITSENEALLKLIRAELLHA